MVAGEQLQAPLEIEPAIARELVRLRIATLIDVRQPTELELEGAIDGAELIPLFDLKKLLGHTLTAEEQEILDCDAPSGKDVQRFITTINRLHHQKGHVLLCLCNSGQRSLHAAELMRLVGYDRAFSVSGGIRKWRGLETQSPPQDDAAVTSPSPDSPSANRRN